MFKKELRVAWSKIPTGVGVLTTLEKPGDIHGITINSFFSLSIKPPMIAVSVSNNAKSHNLIVGNNKFGFSVLNSNQSEYANYFSLQNEETIPSDFRFTELSKGIYVIENSLSQMSCELTNNFSIGDHTIFVANIKKMTSNESDPLIWYKSKFINF